MAGDFDGATYQYDGVAVRMHRDGAGRPVMSFSRPEEPGHDVDAVVVRTVGSRRYQQYLTDVGGVLWRLPMAYHVEERRWFHMNGAFLTPDPERVEATTTTLPLPTGTPARPAAARQPAALRWRGVRSSRHALE